MPLLVPSAVAPAPVTFALNALAPVFVGVVLGRDLAVGFGQNTAASQASVLTGNAVLRLWGNPAKTSGNFRVLGALVPGAMGPVGAKYREWAFSIGCRNPLPG